jgi:hypothetical protein
MKYYERMYKHYQGKTVYGAESFSISWIIGENTLFVFLTSEDHNATISKEG